MAEIVGTIAAIVGIAGACVGLGQNLADCVGTMSYAVDDIEIIVLEVNIFSGLLMSFTKVMKKLNGDQRMDSAMVQAMVQITPLIRLIRRQSKLIKRRLEKFLEKLQSLNLVRDYSMIQRSVGRFWWYFKKSEFVFLKIFLDAAKSNMQLIILLVLLAKNLDHDENKPKDEPKDKAELEDQELYGFLAIALHNLRCILTRLQGKGGEASKLRNRVLHSSRA